MIKIILVILMLAVVFVMVKGIGLLKNNYYWRTQFFAMQYDYLREKVAFINYEHGGIGSWFGLSQGNSIPLSVKNQTAKSLPILLYHGVIEDSNWKLDDVNMSLADFREQMFALKKDGYQTVTLEDYWAFMNGKKTLPVKSFMLTFDDGRSDSYYPVDSILKVLNYTAVMNVITGRSLGPNNEKSNFHLSQIELEKMVESGRWEMASHTQNGHDYEKIGANNEMGHFLSDKLWLNPANMLETDAQYFDRVSKDLAASKADIQNKLGIKTLAFAYPFGDFGQESANYPGGQNVLLGILRKLFPLTFYQTRGSEFMNNYPGDPFMTRRIDMKSETNINPATSAENLLKLLVNNNEKDLNYTDNFTKNNGWLQGWGVLAFSKNKMSISDSPTDDSGMTFLAGSYLWKDYFFQVRTSIQNGGAFALVARYEDENNYVACDFTDIHVALAQHANGQDKPDTEVLQQTNLGSGRIANVGVAVFGNQVSCFLDGKAVISGIISDDLANGGIGFKLWDTNQKKGSILYISDLKVENAMPVSDVK